MTTKARRMHWVVLRLRLEAAQVMDFPPEYRVAKAEADKAAERFERMYPEEAAVSAETLYAERRAERGAPTIAVDGWGTFLASEF